MAVDIDRIIQVLRALAAQVNGFAALRDDGLAKVIVEVLFRIRIRRVELANSGVGHTGLSFLTQRR